MLQWFSRGQWITRRSYSCLLTIFSPKSVVIYGEEVTYILSIKLISFIKKIETLNYYYYYFLEFVKFQKICILIVLAHLQSLVPVLKLLIVYKLLYVSLPFLFCI